MEALKKKIEKLMDGVFGDCGIYIKDLDNGHEISINALDRFHAASTIKIPILWEALRQVEAGEKSLEDEIILRNEEKVGGAGVLQILHDGLSVTMHDLMCLMIDISDNTATNMLMDYLGKENINHTMENLGITNTLVARKLMIVVPGIYSYTCPKDMGKLLERLAYGDGLGKEYADMGMDILLAQQYNDRLSRDLILCGNCGYMVGHENICKNCGSHMGDVDGVPVKFAHKTGEIVGVVHDAGIMYVGDKKIVVGAFTKNLKNNGEGYELLAQIGIEIYEHFS